MASDSRSPKKPHLEGDADTKFAENIGMNISSLEQLQEKIERLNDEESDRIIELAQEFNKKRRPFLEERNKMTKQIPGFWLTVFGNHAVLSQLLHQDDLQVMQYLENIDVEFADDVRSGYTIHFHFAPNQFFENTVLSKQFRFGTDGSLQVTPTAIKWKPGKDITVRHEEQSNSRKKRSRDEQESFFKWFDQDDQEAELGEIIKEQIWPNPLSIYLDPNTTIDSDSEASDSEGFDDEEDEDDGVDDEDEDAGDGQEEEDNQNGQDDDDDDDADEDDDENSPNEG